MLFSAGGTRPLTQLDSTSRPPEGPLDAMDELYLITSKEIERNLSQYDERYLFTQYTDLVLDTSLSLFLKYSTLYDHVKSEWIGIGDAATERDLYNRLKEIVSEIIGDMGPPRPNLTSVREVCSTNYRRLGHFEPHLPGLGSTPALVIKASGPSFENPLIADGTDEVPLGYRNIASCFHVVPEVQISGQESYYACQNAIFAREMLIQQPNRRFVRNLLISESACRLYHFDRAGGQYTAPIDIHKFPRVFVKLILGLSSTHDEDVLGFDTSVKWEVVDGKKVSGTITVNDAPRCQTVYDLCQPHPIYVRHELCGSGTRGWHVRDPSGREVFIKDLWKPEGAITEHELLERTLGVDGTVQLLGSTVAEVTTDILRANFAQTTASKDRKNLVSTRLVTELYGKPITSFKSQKQLIAAIRDVIAALNVLAHERALLHRDISDTNILLGSPGAEVGRRGVLVGFKSAVNVPSPLVRIPTGEVPGTHLYKSIMVLRTNEAQRWPIPHDEFDDLESVYYVLFEIMCTWSAVGEKLEDPAEIIQRWSDSDHPGQCAAHKASHWSRGSENYHPIRDFITSFWFPATVKLIIEFHKIVYGVWRDKDTLPIRYMSLHETSNPDLDELLEESADIYSAIIALFDKALKELEVQERDPNAPRIRSTNRRKREHAHIPYSPPCTRSRTKVAQLATATPSPRRPRTRSQTKAEAERAKAKASQSSRLGSHSRVQPSRSKRRRLD